ncbi:MAG TPA: DUF1972 domain-containing protein, partial [Actinobacteria bacterium]|nr:DUF1972 domain-containing protein [Actinomycetes bacterium]HEX21050.1 DUF1972 domain-containing protein [Actinomycetota bacterium]
MEPIRVAIIGTRGIPANYGGFETFAEELSVRLATRGHHVVVYGRSNNIDYPDKEYRGVRLIILPTISWKHLDTITNTFLSVFHVIIHRVDIVLIPNTGNAALSWIPRIFGIPVLMNVDGLEWKRQKWGKATKKLLKFSEWLATWMPNQIVTDAQVIQDYYKNKYNKHSWMIPYGAYISRQINEEDLKKFELESEKYLLYVSRLEPENNALMVIKAYLQSQVDMNLVIVGDAPYAHDYIRKLKSTAN